MSDAWDHPFWRAAFPWRKVVLDMHRIPEDVFAAHGPFPCNDCGNRAPCPPGRCRAHPALVAIVEAHPAECGGAVVREIPAGIDYDIRIEDGDEGLIVRDPRNDLDRYTFIMILRWIHEPYRLGKNYNEPDDESPDE